MAMIESRDADRDVMAPADIARGVALPAIAVLIAIFTAAAATDAPWLANWRTGLLFSLSVLTIIGGQAFLNQYFEVRALRASLLQRIADKKDAAAALAALVDATDARSYD